MVKKKKLFSCKLVTDVFLPDKFNDSSWWTPGVEVTNAISLNKETPEEEAYVLFSLSLSFLYSVLRMRMCVNVRETVFSLGLRYWIEFPKYGILAYTQRYIGTIYSCISLSLSVWLCFVCTFPTELLLFQLDSS